MKYTKLFFALLIGTFFTLIISSCGGDPAVKNANNAKNKIALELIKKEPKVKEALITDANVLYVSVEDDGTKRDGYTSYLCQILKENNSTVNLVKVIRVNSSNDPKKNNAYGVLLGESNCN